VIKACTVQGVWWDDALATFVESFDLKQRDGESQLSTLKQLFFF
jgi:hypothetical protein